MGATRHSRRTRARVIESFKEWGRVDLACQAHGVSRAVFYEWLKKDPAYAEAFEAARPCVNGMLEDEATRRAYHGTARPTTVAGVRVDVMEYSDNLLMFLLRARNPAVFGQTSKIEHTGNLLDGLSLTLEKAPNRDADYEHLP